MSTSKHFQCENCESEGKIVIKTEDVSLSDIAYCPVCGADIYDEEEDTD